MGCDIHLYTEKRIHTDNGDKWVCCDHFRYNEWYNSDEDPAEEQFSVVEIYDGRDYRLFTALADVRHCDGIDVISEPRGLPEDVSDIVKQKSDWWDVDGHSHSWLTAEELFVYQNAHPVTRYYGMIYGEDLEKFDKYGLPPRTWCGWTSVGKAQYRTWARPGSVVDQLVDGVKERMREVFGIYPFYADKQQEDMFYKNAADFRIVFWFDN